MTSTPDAPVDSPLGRAVSDTAALDALCRVLGSQPFRSASRSRAFLAYVVTETLAGRSARLKERTIGRGALSKSEAFDARDDAAVRVQATRVRSALDRYYGKEGKDDPVRIVMTKGSYIPVFLPSSPRTSESGRVSRSEPSLGPGVVVVDLVDAGSPSGTSSNATALTDTLVHALTRFPGIRVVGPVHEATDTRQRGQDRRTGSRFDAHFVLSGSIRQLEGSLRISVKLADASSGEVVWSALLEQPAADPTGFGGYDEALLRIAAIVADDSGVVHRHAMSRSGSTTNPQVYRAMLDYYSGLEENTHEAGAAALRALDAALPLEPRNPLLLSMLAAAESYVATFLDPTQRDGLLRSSESHAGKSLTIDPTSAHAHITLGRIANLRGQPDVARRESLLAVELSPGHPTHLYGAGYNLVNLGDWDEGIELIRASIALNPHQPTYRYGVLAISSLIAEDYARALTEIAIFGDRDGFWSPLIRGLALSGLGYASRASEEVALARGHEPHLGQAVSDTVDLPPAVRDFLRAQLDALADH